MSRKSNARELAFYALFSSLVGKENIQNSLATILSLDSATGIRGDIEKKIRIWEKNKENIDKIIERHLAKGSLGDIPNVALCALRLGLCEMEYIDDIPAEVAINEAVEIAKKFGDPAIAGLVNAIMDARLKEIRKKGDSDE